MFGGLCRPRSPDAAAAGALSAEPRAEVPMAVPAARSWRRFRERGQQGTGTSASGGHPCTRLSVDTGAGLGGSPTSEVAQSWCI